MKLLQHFRDPKPVNAGEVPTEYSRKNPGLLLLLIDQSTSMNNPWGSSGLLRKQGAADHVNEMINQVLLDSQHGGAYRPRIWIAVCGYSLKGHDLENAFRVIREGWPVAFAGEGEWVRPEADGGTPMSVAFEGARQYLEAFFQDPGRWEQFRNSAPPVIINVTDGEAWEFDSDDWHALSDEVERIWNLKTPQRLSPLVFHVHISDTYDNRDGKVSPLAFPSDPEGLDDFGMRLFKIASQIPDSWVRKLRNQLDRPIKSGAVGLITNAGPKDLMKILTVMSRGH